MVQQLLQIVASCNRTDKERLLLYAENWKIRKTFFQHLKLFY